MKNSRLYTHTSCLISGNSPCFSSKIHVTKPTLPPYETIQPLIKDIFERGWLTNMGQYHQQLEGELRNYLCVDDCVLYANGTLALQAVLSCLALSGEVIVPSFTFPATVHSVVLAGLTPVFCDIEPNFYTVDAGNIESLITEKTSAILAVNLYGGTCDINALEHVAQRHNIKLVFDSAHAFGSSYHDRRLGSHGDAEVFSFHATKLFTTLEGGLITSSSPALCKALRLFRNFGIQDEEHVVTIGTNAKLNEVSAAIGLAQIDQVDNHITASKSLWHTYQEQLQFVPGITLPRVRPKTRSNYQYFPIEIMPEEFGMDRDTLHKALTFDNIYARKYFWPACHTFPMYQTLPSANTTVLKNTTSIARNILCLPIYASMPQEYPKIISEIILSIHHHAKVVKQRIGRSGPVSKKGGQVSIF